MASTSRFRRLATATLMIALAAGLSACGRDTKISEQVMEAKQAADRAEAAQNGAEQALARITRQQQPVEATVVEDEPDRSDEQPEPEPSNDSGDSNS